MKYEYAPSHTSLDVKGTKAPIVPIIVEYSNTSAPPGINEALQIEVIDSPT